MVVETFEGGGTVFFCGNGGSAADAQHLAAEYVVRFEKRRVGLPAVALTVDSSILTAAGNDFGFRRVFARQVEALAREGDLLFLHSTSGASENLLHAAAAARSKGVTTVAFLARDGGPLLAKVDLALVVPTEVTAHAQEMHLALGHAICAIVDTTWAEPELGGGGVVEALTRLRREEKAQTLWYRSLAARAEEAGQPADAERFNGLHADEQHHLSRLTARLLEWDEGLEDLRGIPAPSNQAGPVDEAVRRREEAEIAAYEAVLELDLDPPTRALIEEILASERQHARVLGGKWMLA
jgi:D-sedoheptulose 7-phosphate isomerase